MKEVGRDRSEEERNVAVSIEAEDTDIGVSWVGGGHGLAYCLFHQKRLIISSIGIVLQKRTCKHQILEFKNEMTQFH